MPDQGRWERQGRAERQEREERQERLRRASRRVERAAWVLDDAFAVPGTRLRFGLEPLVGLVPWLGDLASAVFGLWIVVEGARAGLPKVVVARMLVNSLIDLTVGAIPLLGDAFDFVYKSNTRNLGLLQRNADDPDASTRSDWLFVAAVALPLIGLLVAVALVVGALLDLLARVLTL